jgi:spore coat polysaccharide biosynthesis protein SpsF (cytidylyltransferase family)
LQTIAIVQARTGSTRLPGKVLAPLGGVPALSRVLRRLGRARSVEGIVVATTTDRADDIVGRIAEAEGARMFRGHPTDVLGRYLGAADAAPARLVVRITADCPLVMPGIVDAVVEAATAGGYAYTSNTITRTFPKGLDVECFTYDALKRAAAAAMAPHEREHVTPFMRDRPVEFPHGEVRTDPDRSDLRWTLDYPEDLAFLDRVFAELGDPRSMDEVLRLMDDVAAVRELHAAAAARARADG